jgi:hypothetical protein
LSRFAAPGPKPKGHKANGHKANGHKANGPKANGPKAASGPTKEPLEAFFGFNAAKKWKKPPSDRLINLSALKLNFGQPLRNL